MDFVDIENICICCSMPSIDCLHTLTRRKIMANTQSTLAAEAYKKCLGVNHLDLPTTISMTPKICAACMMQLELAYKFYDRCVQTRATFLLMDQQFVACRACQCSESLADGAQLLDMEDREFCVNGVAVKYIDAFFRLCAIPEEKRMIYTHYKICTACSKQLENVYTFREFCQAAFQILKRRYEKKESQPQAVVLKPKPKPEVPKPLPVVPQIPMKEVQTQPEPPSILPELLEPLLDKPQVPAEEGEKDVLANIKVEPQEEFREVVTFERLDLSDGIEDNEMFFDEMDHRSDNSSLDESKDAEPSPSEITRDICEKVEKKKKNKRKKREKKMRESLKKKTPKKIIVYPDCPPLPPMRVDEVGSTIVQEPAPAPAPYKCDVCSTTYEQLRFLKMHQRRHKKDPNYKVTRIRKKPPKTNEYRRLGRACRSEQEYRNELRQAREERIVIGGEPFVCDLCGSNFLKINTLRVHMEKKHLSEDEKQKHLCNQCGQLFKLKSKLTFHMEIHRQYKYRCTMCNASYTYEKDLKRHLFSHTGGRPGFSNCPVCKKSLKTDSIEVHVRNVHVEKKHACDKCDMRFVKKDDLWTHQFDHLGYLPYNCAEVDKDGQLCDFATKKKQSYQVHLMKKHNINYSEALHGYNENRSDLQRELHAEKHHFPKKANNYHCEKCDKGFHTMTGLYHHRRIDHLKVMFKCGFADCGRSFTQKPALWSHSFVHRNLYPYNCEDCSYQSRNKKSFQIHLKRDHDINYREDIHGYKRESFQQVIDYAMNPEMGQALQYSNHYDVYE